MTMSRTVTGPSLDHLSAARARLARVQVHAAGLTRSTGTVGGGRCTDHAPDDGAALAGGTRDSEDCDGVPDMLLASPLMMLDHVCAYKPEVKQISCYILIRIYTGRCMVF